MEEKRADKLAYAPNAVHLMRTVQTAQLQLSAMADQKASLLMAASFVIFTIIVGQARASSVSPPLMILGAAAFIAAIFAIWTVLPVIREPRQTGPSNLLFFGVFTEIPQEEFVEQITGRLHADDDLYRTMARDIHQAGMVLRRKKYRMLRIAYGTLLAGLIASGATFFIRYLA